MVKVTDGRDQVAAADGDFVAERVVGEDDAELRASAEAPAGSTVSCPLWAGPQALSARLAARHSPRVRRRALEDVWVRNIWRGCCAGWRNAALLVVRKEGGGCVSVPGLVYPMARASSPVTRVDDKN